MKNKQSGFIALFMVAIVMLGLSITIGAMIAHLKATGAINASTLAGVDPQQNAKVVADERLIRQWYANASNAYYLDSMTTINAYTLATILSRAGIVSRGENIAVSTRILANGIGYHVFAFWFPPSNAAGVGLNASTGQFSVGTGNRSMAYSVFSGFSIESLLTTQTRSNMQSISSLLIGYFDSQQNNSQDIAVNQNWFCSPGTPNALPCYNVDTDISTTTYQQIGLSNDQMITGWNQNELIMVNSHSLSSMPPYQVVIKAILPWGAQLSTIAISN